MSGRTWLALVVCGCGSGGPPADGTNTLYCPASPLAVLSMSVPRQPNFSLAPMRVGEAFDFTVTVTNLGQGAATELRDITATSDTLVATGNTCPATLAAGASCTLSYQARATAPGRHTNLVAASFYNTVVTTDVIHDISFDVVDAPFAPASPAPVPLMPNGGGGLMPQVRLITLTFSDSTDDAEVKALGDALVGSEWYQALAGEYGLNLATHEHLQLKTASPAVMFNDEDVLRLINSGALPAQNDHRDLYMFFFTPNTAYEFSQVDSNGWHAWRSGVNSFQYACIKPQCPSGTPRSFVAAHELAESITDSGKGFAFTGFPQGEVSDLCDEKFTSKTGYAFPTIWANSQAARGGDPCIPSQGKPYFSVSVSPSGLVQIPQGRSFTFTVTGWSTAPVGDWLVGGTGTTLVHGDAHFHVDFPKDELNNGVQVPLTITVDADTPSGSTLDIPLVSYDSTFEPHGRLQIVSVAVP
jgi:hypothetical protein